MLFKRRFSSAALVALLLAMIVPLGMPANAAQGDNVDVYGRPLPKGAAPYSQQIMSVLCDSKRKETTLSAAVSVYERICGNTIGIDSQALGDALVNLDENLNLIPGAAEKWESSKDGLVWTFHLRPGQVWSDGTPLTANDYVATYRYMADPKHAYDFYWMWSGVIKNWDQSVAGEVTPDKIGVRAVDDLTFEVTTKDPFPPLPGTLYFWAPLQAKALAAYGPNYGVDPAKSVSSGPFMLKEFTPGKSITLVANPTYKGYRKPYLKEIRGVYGDQLNGSFVAFQARAIDHVLYQNLGPADFKIIDGDKELTANYRQNTGDFRTDYLLFDTFNPPFNDVNVRLAFAKALDRESIVKNVIGPRLGIPAYSFLMPGFPASDTAGALHPIQAYDCPAAQALLAKAGFKDGAGFPAVELKLRGESDAVAARFNASAASISKCLNIKITVNNIEFSDYMKKLLARPTTIQFGAISYGMDYLDPANMLGVWVSTGRHSWRNAQFDELVQKANVLVGDVEKRTQMYKDAEKILVEDVGGVFLDHRIQGDLFQPYVMGECFRPDKQGVSAIHWGNDWCWGALYIGDNVAKYNTFRTKN
jgi:peptide/nickel transport system substrate-binding protein/oligopeptide transport system substrate-binding protein